jgi:hypothetical protein
VVLVADQRPVHPIEVKGPVRGGNEAAHGNPGDLRSRQRQLAAAPTSCTKSTSTPSDVDVGPEQATS